MSEMKNDALSIEPMISFSVREARSVSLRRGKDAFRFPPWWYIEFNLIDRSNIRCSH